MLSILEGGYNVAAIARSATSHVDELFRGIPLPPPPALLPLPPSADGTKAVCPRPPLIPWDMDFESSSEDDEETSVHDEPVIRCEEFSDMMSSVFLEMNGAATTVRDDTTEHVEGDGDRDLQEKAPVKLSIDEILSSLDDSIAKLMVSAVTEQQDAGHDNSLLDETTGEVHDIGDITEDVFEKS